jgi:hypothetical protein
MESCCLFLKQKDYSFLPPPLLSLLFLFASKQSKTTSRFHNTPFGTQRPQFLWRWQILLFVFFCWENRRDLYRSPPRLHWPISFNPITPFVGAYVAIFSSHLPSPIVSAIYWLTLRHCIVHRLEHPQFYFCCPRISHTLASTNVDPPATFLRLRPRCSAVVPRTSHRTVSTPFTFLRCPEEWGWRRGRA